MHIPDGYLSPATCAATYAMALPFWYVASQRVKRLLHTRAVPLLAVFSAFSFVIMMFNLPLPGGTTGHAVGVAVAAIVLGPWASMIAISIALLIQAVFFGDGGLTTFAANSLNMAVAGSLVAHWTYRLISGNAALTARRRMVAGAIAGYVALNIAALLTAIEFGIQPMLFLDASGAPLYAPYPLSVAIPAMMAGHLTIAGLAELVITGGLIAYLQRSNPDLLSCFSSFSAVKPSTGMGRSTRALWGGLAALIIASPIGLLAAGTAWGEWGAEDFSSPDGRQEILRASGDIAPPETVPGGLEKLSRLWEAPVPDYAPEFIENMHAGYVVSAALGVGLIVLLLLALSEFIGRKESADTRAD